MPDSEAGKLLWSDSGCVSCVCHPVLSFPVSTDDFISPLSKQTSISEFSFFPPASNRCLSRESRSSWLPWLLTRRSLARSLAHSLTICLYQSRLSRFPLFHFFISLHLCLRPSLFPSLLAVCRLAPASHSAEKLVCPSGQIPDWPVTLLVPVWN